MASRQRQPGLPSGAVGAVVPLPPYEQPSHPLSASAQQALNTLAYSVSMTKLKNHYAAIEEAIPKSAGEANDVLWRREDKARRRKALREKQGLEEEGTDEELENVKETVDGMTKKMEAAMRKLIDGKANVEDMEESVQYLKQNALRLTQAESQTQLTQKSQGRRRNGRRGRTSGSGDEDEDEDMDYEDPGPTPLNMEGIEVTGPSKLWKKRLQEKRDRWRLASHTARYAENNSYIGFRQVINDAQHPNGDVPLPHASTWFNEKGEPALGVTSIEQQAGTGEDSDDDLAIAGGTISTKCPLTLMEFKKPLSSQKCPHSFESAAIMEMINTSAVRLGVGNRSGQRAVQCPVSGCDKMLCASDLKVDPLLIRMIDRIRKAKDLASDNEDEDYSNNQPSGSSMHHAEPLVSSPPATARPTTSQVSRARNRKPDQEPPQSSIILDLGGSDDSDETEEE